MNNERVIENKIITENITKTRLVCKRKIAINNADVSSTKGK